MCATWARPLKVGEEKKMNETEKKISNWQVFVLFLSVYVIISHLAVIDQLSRKNLREFPRS